MPIANWYVVFTRPNWEKKVVGSLSRKGIECYCPHKVVLGISGNKKKVDSKPLFASYIFIRINSSQFNDIRKVEGVINLMYWLDKPAIVRDVEIEMMRRFLNEHESVQIEKAFVNVNDIVKIKNVSNNDESEFGMKSKKIKLTLPSLGYSIVAEVPSGDIEIFVQEDHRKRLDPSKMQNTLNYGL